MSDLTSNSPTPALVPDADGFYPVPESLPEGAADAIACLCPDCGSRLYVQIHDWEYEGTPTADGVQVICAAGEILVDHLSAANVERYRDRQLDSAQRDPQETERKERAYEAAKSAFDAYVEAHRDEESDWREVVARVIPWAMASIYQKDIPHEEGALF